MNTETRPPLSLRRKVAIGVILVLALLSVLYRVLYGVGLEQSSLMFIGLPALGALAILAFVRPSNVLSVIFWTITLLLLISGVVFLEGLVCILFAAPIFYLVGCIIGFAIREFEHKAEQQKRLRLIVVPLVTLFALEGIHPSLEFPSVVTVVVERSFPGDPLTLWSRLDVGLPLAEDLPLFTALGFPTPSSQNLGEDGQIKIHFQGPPNRENLLVIEATEVTSHARSYRFVTDSTPISHWMTWESAKIEIVPQMDGTHELRWAVTYERELHPAWYFGPIQRAAVRATVEYLVDSLTEDDG